MKVGILTHHRSYNFGANLQALALQSALLAKGVSPIFINYQEKSKIANYREVVSPEQAEEHEIFCNKYLIESPVFYDDNQIKEFCLDSLDVVLVGSDAVFRLIPKYDPINILKIIIQQKRYSDLKVTEQLPPYWLDWPDKESGKNIIRASIAASSMGTCFFFLPIKLLNDLRHCIKQFDYISVRDNWTQRMIWFISLGVRMPEICPDPVFSLRDNFSIHVNECPQQYVSNTILLSGKFNNKWIKSFVRHAHDLGHTVATLPNPDLFFEYPEVDFNIPLPLSPIEWYLLLANAAGYVGIRFHALVSCIANQTPAVSVDSLSTSRVIKSGSKMYDLCQRGNMPQRYYLLRQINRTHPAQVLRNLFDSRSLDNANEYSGYARNRFMEIIEKILRLASTKTA